MKKILGLDLGTNSIGWALVTPEESKIWGMNSRIIPMSQDIIGDFEKGNSVSQTKARTGYRSARRLHERHLLRRQRLHRVLNLLGFLPDHYAKYLDRYGNFMNEKEVKLPYISEPNKKAEFLFKDSYNEMLVDFRKNQPQLFYLKPNGEETKIPYDWTIYYLRKKALSCKISKEELAWLLLHFNQKRGYYQLRGEDEENKEEKFEIIAQKVLSVKKGLKDKKFEKFEYSAELENGLIYKASFYSSIEHWVGQVREFVVKESELKDGTKKTSISFLPTFDEIDRMDKKARDKMYSKIKIKTEREISKTGKTVGQYIFDTLLQSPDQKIRGKLIRTIERNFYKDELEKILACQIALHEELRDDSLYKKAIEALYESNIEYRSTISKTDFKHLFVDNIIFYQRPLKSKKSEISDCAFEYRKFKNKEGKEVTKPIKCISRSHPLFQEFRIWQWMQNLRIYEREKYVNDKYQTDVDVTNEFLGSEVDYVRLFDFLFDRKEVDQKALLKHFKLNVKTHRWNFVDDDKKNYPCNETHVQIVNRLLKVEGVPAGFLTQEKETALWHILYSVKDNEEIKSALGKYAVKNHLDKESFIENFKKYPLIKCEYGSYSEKAIKKLLPLMRLDKYWNKEQIHPETKTRIVKIIYGECDEKIRNRVREKAINLTDIEHYRGLPLWLASYIVYNRHSESGDSQRWETVANIEKYLKEFKQHSLRNPIVEQVVTETLRVVRDIWKQYGNENERFFDEIHVELGRDMKNNAEDRKTISEGNLKNETTNLRIRAMLSEFVKPEYMIEGVRPYSPYQQEALRIFEDGIINSGIELDEDIEKISKSPQPTSAEILRYKLWLEQRYRSPYTGEIIPIGKLFTPEYEIEHIIPQSIYFDDSFSNKVICESVVNKKPYKDNQLGFEFISSKGGCTVPELSTKEHTVKILNKEQYQDFIKCNYSKNKTKAKKLLLEEIPEKMIERQLNDTRYISKLIKNLLSNLVRDERDDDGFTSKNLIPVNGAITNALKQDWGMNDVWNDLMLPRFERLNRIVGKEIFTTYNESHRKLIPTVPLEYRKGFQLKRIDHRHHAMDALVIALATRNHVNYLNNQTALDKTKKKSKEEKQKDRQDLKRLLCYKAKADAQGNYKWFFHKPWESITQDARYKLETTVVSFKQNMRVINKTVNYYQKFEEGRKQWVQQVKGENWAIRRSLHTPMPYGKNVYDFDVLKIHENIRKREFIIDDNIKKQINKLMDENDKKVGLVQSLLKKNPLIDRNGTKIIETAFRIRTEKFRKRKSIFDLANRSSQGGITSIDQAIKLINKVSDYSLRRDLLSHLQEYNRDLDKAFSIEGIEKFNQKRSNAVYKLPIAESGERRLQLGNKISNKHKYIESDTGANLYFAIYQNEAGERSYDSIPLNVVIERLKQGLIPVPEKENHILLFWLNPGDLVYLPSIDEKGNNPIFNQDEINKDQIKRIFVVNDFSGNTIYFTPCTHAKNIVPKEVDMFYDESKNKITGSFDNKTASFDGKQIKEACIKLKIDRLGNVSV
mgnify:CR=1 FL=1